MTDGKNILVKVDGKSFRCSCGCNVFHHPDEKPAAFECNACGAWYIDPADEAQEHA